nr:recombinase family protein [Vibrio rotiferianus]
MQSIKKRGAFGAFLTLVEEGIVKPGSVLIIESLDRMSREQPYKAQSTLNDLINADITIITTMDKKVFNKETLAKDPLGTMLMAVLEMVRAHKESLVKQERSIDAIIEQITLHENGDVADVAGAIPFWISRKPKPKNTPKKIKGGFEFNEQESTIRLIVDLYSNQRKGLRPISRELLERKIPSPKGGKIWGVSTISAVLANPALCGRKVFKLRYLSDGKQIETDYHLDSYFPAIMSEEDFDAMQAIKKRKAGSTRGRGKWVYMLTNYGEKSRCAKCGSSIGSQPAPQKDRIRRRLHCSKNKETGDCCDSIIQDYIEDAFLRSVSAHIDYNLINKNLDPNEAILVSERLQNIEIEIDNLYEMMKVMERDPKRAARARKDINELYDEKERLQKQERDVAEFQISSEDIHEFVLKVNKARDFEDLEARHFVKHILSQCISKIEVHMKPENLGYYGYENICQNALVNRVDVEFYSDKSLSIFVRVSDGELLFTKICDEFADSALGSFTEEELQIWNNQGEDELDKHIAEKRGDKLDIKEQAWFTIDVGDAILSAMFDALDQDE